MKISGIYRIVNKLNGKSYIGSSVRLERRWSEHRLLLRNNKHHSPHLQRSWNKHGEENFAFEIILDVEDKNNLIAWEQIWMDVLKPEYNICQVAGSRLGAKCSEEARAKMSAAKKGKTHSEETKAKMRRAENKTKVKLKATREDGLIIYFESFSDAARSGFNLASVWEATKKGRRYRGFLWEKT